MSSGMFHVKQEINSGLTARSWARIQREARKIHRQALRKEAAARRRGGRERVQRVKPLILHEELNQ